MKTLISVTETIQTGVGLMRPGVPYALDMAVPAQAIAADALLAEGGVGRVLTDADAAALLGADGHYSDDAAAPVFDAEAARLEAVAATKKGGGK